MSRADLPALVLLSEGLGAGSEARSYPASPRYHDMTHPLVTTARRATSDAHLAEYTLRDLRHLVAALADEVDRLARAEADAQNYRAMFRRLAVSARRRVAELQDLT